MILLPSKGVWSPPRRQRGFFTLPGAMGVLAKPADAGGGGGGGHAHWRLYVTETIDTGSTRCDLRLLQFRETAGVGQPATGSDTVTASDNQPNAEGIMQATVVTTLTWSAFSLGGAGPWWIACHYSVPRNVVQVLIHCSNGTGRAPRDFQIHHSDNGSDWTTAMTVLNEPAWTSTEGRTYSIP